MRLAQNQADWYKDTFDALVENVAGVVLGKESVIELTFTTMLAGRPPAARGCAGNRKDTAGQVDGRDAAGHAQPHPVHPTCCRAT